MLASSRQAARHPLHVIFHPFEGFWELKYEQSPRKARNTALVILALLAITTVLKAQYSGFLVNMNNPTELNSLMEIVYVLVPVMFWCTANWSLTTLMDGEGKFSEIFASTCFALVPLVLIQFPWIWLSQGIALEELSFYRFFNALAAAWSLYLLFVGNMTVHQFTPGKTILTMFLTVVAMGFMAFLCLLFFSLIQQITSFVYTIYQELALRG
ncbi:YIP1 family protein [Saccharibacillus sp. O23]|uniref:Yip1 family protein n=1 Tax=Saccharibacillus sp. O23 TaxID=2009338 RepID=UPI000B4E437F|nr:Yip1 family protein [Saccharibacillus sp. O23]OWR28274.1 YIP1 family protein [Saccharibacillus sp. O23]